MRARNSNVGYGWVFWSLHWTSATLFLLVAIVATSIDGAPDATQRAAFVARHASLGQALLVVMLARVIWRFINPNPVWSYPVGRPRKLLAVLVHWLIHATVLIESLTGLALIGAGAALAPLFAGHADGLHSALPNLIYLLLLAHILAAALHQVSALQGRASASSEQSD